MSPERFEHMLSTVRPNIKKKPCKSRVPISPEERLMITLRYLAICGDSQQSHSFSFRIGRATVSKILRQTCEALWVALKIFEYLNLPSTTEDWIRIQKNLRIAGIFLTALVPLMANTL